MSIIFCPVSADSDYEAWKKFKETKHRWTFNKLEVAMRQGLHAGPAAIPPEKDGWYIHRPAYNLYGMGIGAKKFFYSSKNFKQIINHGFIPPGNFWCEWIEGDHLSIDYRKDYEGVWHIVSVWKGVLFSDDNLTKFQYWEKLENFQGIGAKDLPPLIDWLDDDSITCFNLEIKKNHIIEIHLRSGEEIPGKFSVGDKVFPLWEDSDYSEYSVLEDPDPEMSEFKAHGHLASIRKGFAIKSKQDK